MMFLHLHVFMEAGLAVQVGASCRTSGRIKSTKQDVAKVSFVITLRTALELRKDGVLALVASRHRRRNNETGACFVD